MSKKIIALTIVLFGYHMTVTAQGVWQVPKKPQQVENIAETNLAKDTKKAKTDNSENARKKKLDPRYAEGAVPETDGKVEWQWTVDMPGYTADQAYNEMMTLMESLTTQPEQTDRSHIAAVNPSEHIIAANLVETLEFSKNAISHDFTVFRYSLICKTFDGKAVIRMCRLVYDYEKNRSTGATYTAEEWITDRACLNKSKTKIYPINAKFRKKTIDRAETIFNYFDQAVKLKK